MRGKKQPDNGLPRRLFATDRFPSNRLNIYSKPDIIPFIQHVLRGTEELQYIKDSCFGKLFELPSRQCPVSCKLIHSLLTRQLICVDALTLWTVFRSDPIRFGLQEFGTITGLPCGDFPKDYETELEDQSKVNRDPDWIKLIGKRRFVTIADLRHKLETDIRMPGLKKLQIALILIVDGVLIAHQQKTRPTLKYVKMVQDVDAFCQHPWGRESFLKTITCMKPPIEYEDPAGQLVRFLKQDSFRLQGFPLALQLLAFQAVPQLLSIIPAPLDTISISQLEEPQLPVHSNISYVDILRVEAEENLEVISLIPIQSKSEPGWGVWPHSFVDERVTYMETLIANHHPFKKHHWPGGDSSCPILVYVPPEEHPTRRRNPLKPRKTLTKPSSGHRQTRISNFFSRTGSTINSDDQVLQMLTKVSDQLSKLRREQKLLRKLVRRRKPRVHSTRSSFHCNGKFSSKKPHLSHIGCQTDPMEQTPDVPINNHCSTPMEEDKHHSSSPVISQYGYQLYGQRTSPTHTPFSHEHNSPAQKSPKQTSPIRNSGEQTSPTHRPADPTNIPHLSNDHTSPIHNSSEHPSPIHSTADHTSPDHKSTEHSSAHSSHEYTSDHNTSNIHKSTHSPSQEKSTDLQPSPSGTPPWLITPKSPTVIYRSTIYDAADHPNSPPFHHLLYQGLQIFEPISPAPSQLNDADQESINNPRYDTSTRRDPPHHITPDTSPNKIIGFAEHAHSINPFAATATSIRKSKPIFDQSQEKHREEDSVDVSDSSPARPTPMHQPSDEERQLAKELLKQTCDPLLSLFAPLPLTQWELFFSVLQSKKEAFHITPSKFDFSNKFILEIAEPQKWINTFHMEILMHILSGRHREVLQLEKSSFTTPFLTSGIQEIWKRFKPLKRKDRFQWNNRLTELVLQPGEKWMEDVITVYSPMCWEDRHWVGLVINLDMGYVEILDPLPSLYSDKKVVRFMEPVLTALPYLVKKVARPQQTQFRGLKPFYWKRIEGHYINERGGDCGPVSIKFMELHAYNDPDPGMSGITDSIVDDLRKQYAMDVYKNIVLPAYQSPTIT